MNTSIDRLQILSIIYLICITVSFFGVDKSIWQGTHKPQVFIGKFYLELSPLNESYAISLESLALDR